MIARSALAALLSLTACEAPTGGRVIVGYQQSRVDGDVGLGSTAGADPVPVDVRHDLGQDGEANSLYARGELDSGAWRFLGSGFQYRKGGAGTLSDRYGDIPAGTDVRSDLDLLILKGAAAFDAVEAGVFRLSPGLAVDFFDSRLRVADSSGAPTDGTKEQVGIPMLFANQELDLGPVFFELDAAYSYWPVGELQGTFWDFEVLVGWVPEGSFMLAAGYRALWIDANGSEGGREHRFDGQVRGWFVGAGLAF